MSAASDLMSKYQHHMTALTFEMGGKGVFDVEVDGDVIYSKGDTGRHAEPGEVLELFEAGPGAGLSIYGT